ncbi:MAG: phosphoribosyltransferase family protein, partial [Anaerolineaceae bacterium]|nr:phosphoribosyltransferase family protein [Anaerolineaceae bacterium]
MIQDYHDFLAEVLIPEDTLQKRIAELGEQISHDYQGKNLLLICILRGGVVFLTDLMRHIKTPHAIEFMAVSSYGSGKRASEGQVRITLDLNTNIMGRDVLVVEDIIDSGHTLFSVIEMLSTRTPTCLY